MTLAPHPPLLCAIIAPNASPRAIDLYSHNMINIVKMTVDIVQEIYVTFLVNIY